MTKLGNLTVSLFTKLQLASDLHKEREVPWYDLTGYADWLVSSVAVIIPIYSGNSNFSNSTFKTKLVFSKTSPVIKTVFVHSECVEFSVW